MNTEPDIYRVAQQMENGGKNNTVSHRRRVPLFRARGLL